MKIQDEPAPGTVFERVPIFPLPGSVFFPHTLLPLHVFEPRYLALVADSRPGEGLVGVPLLQGDWRSRYYERPDVAAVFGLGRLVHREGAEDGPVNILLRGIARVRLLEESVGDRPYRVVRAEVLDDRGAGEDAGATARELIAARQLFAGIISSLPGVALKDADALFDPDMPARKVIDSLCSAAPLSPEDKQRLLEQLSPLRRAAHLTELLAGVMLAEPDGQ